MVEILPFVIYQLHELDRMRVCILILQKKKLTFREFKHLGLTTSQLTTSVNCITDSFESPERKRKLYAESKKCHFKWIKRVTKQKETAQRIPEELENAVFT